MPVIAAVMLLLLQKEESKALALMQDLQSYGLEPDTITYTTAITACGAVRLSSS